MVIEYQKSSNINIASPRCNLKDIETCFVSSLHIHKLLLRWCTLIIANVFNGDRSFFNESSLSQVLITQFKCKQSESVSSKMVDKISMLCMDSVWRTTIIALTGILTCITTCVSIFFKQTDLREAIDQVVLFFKSLPYS